MARKAGLSAEPIFCLLAAVAIYLLGQTVGAALSWMTNLLALMNAAI